MREIRTGQFYRHFKGGLYQIVGVAEHTETGEKLVIYQALYGDYKIYARPYEMFAGETDHEKYPEVTQKYRFELTVPGETVTEEPEKKEPVSVAEAQKEEPGKYYILNRAIFYIGRIVSSQKGRDFVKSEYNKMKRVYSIWICMNMKENSLTQIYLTKKNIIGSHDWKGDLELLNIIMIGIAENLPEKEENYELHRLLSALLSSSLEAEEKLDIIEKEYDIPIEDDIREEVEEMCNLSQGIKEKAFEGGYLMGQEEGRESGYAEGKQNGYAEAVCLMYESGLSIEQIAGIIKMSADEVRILCGKNKGFPQK